MNHREKRIYEEILVNVKSYLANSIGIRPSLYCFGTVVVSSTDQTYKSTSKANRFNDKAIAFLLRHGIPHEIRDGVPSNYRTVRLRPQGIEKFLKLCK